MLTYTADSPGMTFNSGFNGLPNDLRNINNGDISTSGFGDFQVHATNAAGRTITMTFASPVTVNNAVFHNRTSCCGDRVGEAQMTFKDNGGATLYTYTFPGPDDNTTSNAVPGIVTIIDPAGDIAGVKTVELTNIQQNGLNFREIEFNSTSIAFTSLFEAYEASQQVDFIPGIYSFDIGGNIFTSHVDTNGYVLVASGDGTTDDSPGGYLSLIHI